jgi:hypothetical protein
MDPRTLLLELTATLRIVARTISHKYQSTIIAQAGLFTLSKYDSLLTKTGSLYFDLYLFTHRLRSIPRQMFDELADLAIELSLSANEGLLKP